MECHIVLLTVHDEVLVLQMLLGFGTDDADLVLHSSSPVQGRQALLSSVGDRAMSAIRWRQVFPSSNLELLAKAR